MSMGGPKGLRVAVLGLLLFGAGLIADSGTSTFAKGYDSMVLTQPDAGLNADDEAPAGIGQPAAGSSSTFVPVLMYHYIRVNPDPRDRTGYSLSVTPANFHIQMEYLARNHFNVLRLDDAVQAIKYGRPLPPRPVVLTFDDGYADFFTAAVPEMRRFGFTGTDYVVPNFVGRGSFMTWDQIRAADAMGFTIAAHTMNHVPLASSAWGRALWEMSQSKRVLESVLGHRVSQFAYPYGSFNVYLAAQARSMGFEAAASTLPGAWHQPGELGWLYRQRVSGWTSIYDFARLVGGPDPRLSPPLTIGASAPAPGNAPAPAPTPAPALITKHATPVGKQPVGPARRLTTP
jgi:peptidoglycan/xylan/chitin deacetylase (PgdA/CDA1 family)